MKETTILVIRQYVVQLEGVIYVSAGSFRAKLQKVHGSQDAPKENNCCFWA
jgi:hypothetical protein